MEIADRPFTKNEREELESYVALYIQLLRAVLFLVFIAFVGTLLRSIEVGLLGDSYYFLIATAIVAALIYFRSKRWTGGTELRRQIREDLKVGKAKVLILEPATVVEIEEVEDEGPSYIIENTSGETILLTGQHLYQAKHRRFPWSRIEIVEAPHSSMFLSLKKAGSPIPVTSKRAALPYETAKQLGCFDRSYIILDEAGKSLLNKT
jgi:hypothetical protein